MGGSVMALYTATPPEGAKQKVFGRVVPFAGENYPVVDSDYLKGGYRVIHSNTTRNNIPTSHRKHGMKVYKQDDQTVWRLKADLTTWEDVTPTIVAVPFTRSQWTNGVGYGFIERTTWNDGRHEYRTVMHHRKEDAGSHDFKYRNMSSLTFTVPFVGDPAAFADGHDTERGLIWGTFASSMPSKTRVTPQLKGNTYGCGGYLHIHVIGRK